MICLSPEMFHTVALSRFELCLSSLQGCLFLPLTFMSNLKYCRANPKYKHFQIHIINLFKYNHKKNVIHILFWSRFSQSLLQLLQTLHFYRCVQTLAQMCLYGSGFKWYEALSNSFIYVCKLIVNSFYFYAAFTRLQSYF